jgi:hypothetical protein
MCLHAVGAPHAFGASEWSYAVNRLGPDDIWVTYTARGDMNMTWDFGKRQGDLTISDYH